MFNKKTVLENKHQAPESPKGSGTGVFVSPLKSSDTDNLLEYSQRLADAGNSVRARAILRLLSQHHADDIRVWLWLAHYTEDPAEKHYALECALSLDPTHSEARDRLNRLHSRLAEIQPVAQSPQSPQLGEPKRRLQHRIPSTLGGLVVLILVFVVTISTSLFIVTFLKGLTPDSLFVSSPTRTPHPLLQRVMPKTPTPEPRPTPTVIPIGSIVEVDNWQLKLIQPSHTTVLTGSIGQFQPQHQFVLVLLTVSNTLTDSRQLPPDFFVVTDEAAKRYEPVVGASTAYLDMYGWGKVGDLAFEDAIPAGGGMYSVPLIFDLPFDVVNPLLTIREGKSNEGWLLGFRF